MKLLPADQVAVDAALAKFRQRSQAALQQPDYEATRQALFSASLAISQAIATIQAAEYAARNEALRQLETA